MRAVNDMAFEFPQCVTHYYIERPFQSITMLEADERRRVLAELATRRELKRRLRTEFYFEERIQYELLMREQFLAKGGQASRQRPHYGILGESEVWADITSHSIRIPLSAFPLVSISFTYTDSWVTYVDRNLSGNPIPRKPQYGMVYSLAELPALFEQYGWPGDRWKTEPGWEHDVYVEAQIWSDEPIAEYLI